MNTTTTPSTTTLATPPAVPAACAIESGVGMAKAQIVGVAEVATALGVEANTVQVWRHRGVLPPPDWTLAMGPVWRWSTIKRWAIRTGRLDPDTTTPFDAS